MTKNKGLFIMNIIMLVILLAAFVFSTIIAVDFVEMKDFAENNPDADFGEGLGNGIGMAVLLVILLIMMIPVGICTLLTIVTLCKKYINWLSIANLVLCVVVMAIVAFCLIIV